MSATKPNYDAKAPVMVTGATGYVAGWLIKRLLDEGKTVHAAVRDPSKVAKTSHLSAMASSSRGDIKFFKADLLEEGSYTEAMKGCDVVFHTASPFTSKITDPQRDLVDPAVKGTRNVLETANATKSVKRVVLTSSCASIYGDNQDVAEAPGGVLTEEVWNTTSRLDHQAYSFSKVEAEKAAWEIADAQDQWKLVVVNPALVVGPGTANEQTSESFAIARQLGDGTMKSGVPKWEIGCVDVRDVAEAHMLAGFVPDAEGRHITVAETKSFLDLGQALRAKYGDAYPFPNATVPTWLLWLVGPIINKQMTREMISKNMGIAWKADNTKSKEALGLEYHSVDTALQEMFQQLIDTGQIKKA
ncbi:MAG: NAD-dependent epimerase/dehydratase family protein [Pseudomonadota bacterium]